MNEEIVEKLYDGDIRVEKIFSNGCETDWLLQDEDEFVYLLEGNAILEYQDHEKFLIKGDYECIPKNIKHRVKAPSQNCTWLCVFKKEKND